jgi:hypothetical protein
MLVFLLFFYFFFAPFCFLLSFLKFGVQFAFAEKLTSNVMRKCNLWSLSMGAVLTCSFLFFPSQKANATTTRSYTVAYSSACDSDSPDYDVDGCFTYVQRMAHIPLGPGCGIQPAVTIIVYMEDETDDGEVWDITSAWEEGGSNQGYATECS